MHGGQGDAQDGARVAWIDDAVVVHARAVEERVRLAFDLLLDGVALLLVGLGVERSTGRRGRLPGDDRHHTGELLWTHDRHLRVRPGEQEPRAERTTTHAVVAGAVRRTHDDRDVRHAAVRHGVDHLG